MWRQSTLSVWIKNSFFSLCACVAITSTAAADTVLRYSSWLPGAHTLKLTVFDPWAKRVEEVTEGRVKVEVMPKVIGSIAGQFDAVRNGLADIALVVNGYTPGRFPIAEIGELPFLGDKASVTSPAYYRLYSDHFQKYNEYKGVHVLSTFTVGSGHVFTAKKKINTVSDFSGLKIRNPSGSTLPIMDALDMVPVQKAITETYELVSTGVVDGVIMPREAVDGYKLVKILPHYLKVPGGLYNSVLTLAINEKKWNAISVEDRKAIMEVSGENLATIIGQTYDRIDKEAIDAVKANKSDTAVASPELLAELYSRLGQKMDAIWAEKAKKKGMDDASAILAQYRKELLEAGATSDITENP